MLVSSINDKDAVTDSNILGYLYTNKHTFYLILTRTDRPFGGNMQMQLIYYEAKIELSKSNYRL